MTTEPLHCWEVNNCPIEHRLTCPGHRYPEERCWLIASNPNNGCLLTKGIGFMYCATKCAWFKKNNPSVYK